MQRASSVTVGSAGISAAQQSPQALPRAPDALESVVFCLMSGCCREKNPMTTRSDLLRGLAKAGLAHTELRMGSSWLVVVPGLAARILGAGMDEENALWVAPKLVAAPWAEGGNAGGMRTWLAPELGPKGFFGPDVAGWQVPPALDPGAYSPTLPADAKPGWHAWRTSLTADAADDGKYPISITRSVQLDHTTTNADDPSLRFRFRHELSNEGSTVIGRRVGLWLIAQVPSAREGVITIGLRDGAATDHVRPYFTELPMGALLMERGVACLRALGGTKYKIGVRAAAATGSIDFEGPARLGSGRMHISLRFPVDPAGTYLDRPYSPLAVGSAGPGDAVQAYNDPGTGAMAFSEIEVHAPAYSLEPGQCQCFEIEVTVRRVLSPGRPSR